MSSVTRITKRYVYSEMHRLAKETGLNLELEQNWYGRKILFTLYQKDENGKPIKNLIEDEYTTKEMYLALKAAREIYEAATKKEAEK